MVSNSLTFAIFFAIVWATYRWLRSWPLRKAFLLVASYFFYAAWNPWFLGLLWFSTALAWYAARAIAATNRPALRRLWVGASLVGNLVPLLFFKYGNFLVANFEQLGTMSGSDSTFTTLDIVLRPASGSTHFKHSVIRLMCTRAKRNHTVVENDPRSLVLTVTSRLQSDVDKTELRARLPGYTVARHDTLARS
jgi:D-alanyl-lipoteichoic acid acyltransferase DltB (MBOAT superfamily)